MARNIASAAGVLVLEPWKRPSKNEKLVRLYSRCQGADKDRLTSSRETVVLFIADEINVWEVRSGSIGKVDGCMVRDHATGE
jgi:hypothetical protein